MVAIPEVYFPITLLNSAPLPSAPANGATIATDTPILSIAGYTVVQGGIILPQRVQFQWATDTGFTTNVVNVFTDFGITSVAMTAINKLTSEGTWYLRCRYNDILGNNSAWGSGFIGFTGPFTYNTIINSHPPQASNFAPTGNKVVGFGTGNINFDWDFTDPSVTDVQSAYQLVVTDTTTGTTVIDTGKVTSANTNATPTISATYEDKLLSWSVKLWDSHDVAGIFSDLQYFYISVAPTPALTSPTVNQVLGTTIPTITWTPGISGSKTEAYWRVLVTQSGNVIYDTGTAAGAATSFTMPGGVLLNNSAYTVTVTVTDSLGLITSVSNAFTVTLVTPAIPSPLNAYTYDYDSYGFVWIGWDNSDLDVDFIYWNVYRKQYEDTTWTLLGSIPKNLAQYGVADYTANANTNYQYAVTQVVNRGGTGNFIESAFTGQVNVYVPGNYYWLIDTLAIFPAIPIFNGTADSLTNEYERNTYNVIGRGRHVDIGEHLGANGTLTVQLTDRALGYLPITNYLWDPSFQDSLPYSPEWTFASSGSVGYSALSPMESPPSGKQQILKVDFAASSNVTFVQTLSAAAVITPANTFNVGIYLQNYVPANGFTVQAILVYKNAAGTTLTTHTLTLTSVENWQGNSNWFRYAVGETVPAGANATVSVQFKLTDTSGNGGSIGVTGAQVAPVLGVYVDGDQHGVVWQGIPFKSNSFASGFYTARQQRQDIEDLAALERPVYLRNPFGDIYEVSLGDVAFERASGTGSQMEYGTLGIPYLEVAL